MISETTIDRERTENPIILYGNCPIIITIPHDGDLKEFDGTHLAFVPENKRRDLHTKENRTCTQKRNGRNVWTTSNACYPTNT